MAAPLPTGRVLGPYELLATLGRGGMGAVHRARHRATGEEVALKTVEVEGERVVQAIRREVRALMRVRHPGVVRIVADGVEDGLPWYAMELVHGVTLGELARTAAGTAVTSPARADTESMIWTRSLVDVTDPGRSAMPASVRGPLHISRVLTVARALCASLSHLHGEGLVHRDLKPDNVILRPDDFPVIVDFGLATELRGSTSREALDARHGLAGTAAYMAPETIRGEAVDARADLYALGCLLYELATGVQPFSGLTTASVLHAHLAVTPPPPSHVVPELPEAFDALVLWLLQKDPRDRIGHADDVSRVLELLGATPPSVALPTARPYLYRPGFVGRRAPLEALRGALDRARRDDGLLVLVGGESGIGKTRLVNRLGTDAAARGFLVLEGQCTSERARPLEAFERPLEQLADRARTHGAEAVIQLFGVDARVLVPFVPALADLPGLASLPAPPPLAPDAARLRVFQALGDVLVRASREAPLLVVLDDLQWADALTFDLLVHLCRTALGHPSLVLLGTHRTETPRSGLTRLLDLDRTLRVDLGRLDEADVRDMVDDMLAHESADALARSVATQSGGNPFFVAEYLYAALEQGLLHRDPTGRWHMDTPVTDEADGPVVLPLPGSIGEIVEQRLADLRPSETRLLWTASVLGRESTLPSLVATSGLDEGAVFEGLWELGRRQVLENVAGGGVRFTHDKLREVPYAAMPAEVRRELHRRAADSLRAQHHDEPPWEGLARHLLAAGETARGVDALDGASADALARSAHRRAERHVREALALARVDDARRPRWELRLGEALVGQGEVGQGHERLVRSLALRGMPTAAGAAELATGLLRELGRQAGRRLGPGGPLTPPADPAASLEVTRTYQRLVESYWFRNDVPRMVHAAVHALNLAEAAGPSAELARAYATMCLASGSIPIHPLAEHYAALAMGTTQAVADPATEAYVRFLCSVYRVGAAKWEAVSRDLDRAIALCEEAGDMRFLGESHTVLGMAALYRGDLGEAGARFSTAGEAGRRFDNAQHRLWSALGRAEARLRAGDTGAARALLAEADAEASAPTTPAAERFRLGGLAAEAALAEGDLDGAERAAEEAERHGQAFAVPTAHYLLEAYAGVAEARLALAEASPGSADRRRDARAAVRRLRLFAMIFRIGEPRALALGGALRRLEGDGRGARRTLRRAQRRAAALGMREEARRAGAALDAR